MEGQIKSQIRTMARDLEKIRQQQRQINATVRQAKQDTQFASLDITKKNSAKPDPPPSTIQTEPKLTPSFQPPITKPIETIVETRKQPTLAEILERAKKRATEAAPEQKPEQKLERYATQRAIEALLPIEEAQGGGKLKEMPLKDALPKAPRVVEPAPPRLEPVLPRLLSGRGEPPQNLPTGEWPPVPTPSVPAHPLETKLPELPEPPTISLTQPLTPSPKPPQPTKPTLKTPEEILGLSGEQAGLSRPPLPKITERQVLPPLANETVPPKPPATKEPQPIKTTPKFAALTIALGFVALALLGGIVWRIFIYTPPVPPIPIGSVEQPLPESLISYKQVETVKITSLNYDALKPRLDLLSAATFEPESLAYIPIKLAQEQETSYLTFAQLLRTLQIDAPPALFDYKEYTLFLYTQRREMQSICKEANIEDVLCYGPRLGLIIKLPEMPLLEEDAQTLGPDSPAKPLNIAQNAMKEWEKTLARDLLPLMLFVPQQRPSKAFETGRHAQLDTRYINLPIHSMSVDWVLTQDYLVIATSKDAARAAVDNYRP